MQTIMNGRAPAAEPVSAAPAHDEPKCIFAALIDSLTSQEHYTLVVRNGELHIAPTDRRYGPQAGVMPTGWAA